MVVSWRVVKARYARSAFSGEGARRADGRWHSAGLAVVYTSANQALAMLEVLANFSGAERHMLPACVLISATFPEGLVETVRRQDLPPGWDAPSGSVAARAFGRGWRTEGRSAVLRVPSVLVPDDFNFLLNPHHPRFSQIRIGDPIAFAWDPRFKAQRE